MTEQPEPEKPGPPTAFGELTVAVARDGDEHTVTVAGELDVATAERVEQALMEAEAGDARAIVLDLSGLTFMDSTGVRLLVNANTRARTDDCRLTLVRGPAAVQRVMELSGVDELLPFAD